MESRCGEDRWRIQWTIYSWWDVKQKAKYSGYLGTQGDPRRPNALFIIKVIQSGPFTSSLNWTRGGGGLRLPSFCKNILGLWLNLYIQHYPVTICSWFGVNPSLWFIHLVNLSYGSCSLGLNHASVVSDMADSYTSLSSGWPFAADPSNSLVPDYDRVLTWKLSLSRLNSAEV